VLHTGLQQATYTCVPVSPSSVIWYQLKSGYVLWLASHWACITDLVIIIIVFNQ